MKWLLFVVIACGPAVAKAFPELVRHGYTNCTSCHISPTGGDLTTAYGRALSKEVLSTWGYKREESLFHGALDKDSIAQWLNIGGDVRAIQVHQSTPTEIKGRFFPMQADLEVAITRGPFLLAGAVGAMKDGKRTELGSRRYYGLYRWKNGTSLRIGRFFPAFGLNIPEHHLVTRRGLGFDQGQERDNLELSWIDRHWNVYLTASQSSQEVSKAQQERALATQVSYGFSNQYKLGVSHWWGESEWLRRQMLSLHAILGFTEQFYLLSESVWNSTDFKSTGQARMGLSHLLKLGYEIHKGLHLLALEEYQQSDLDTGASVSTSYGLGLQWFPRPHWEIQALWQKQRLSSYQGRETDFAWFLIHYYL